MKLCQALFQTGLRILLFQSSLFIQFHASDTDLLTGEQQSKGSVTKITH